MMKVSGAENNASYLTPIMRWNSGFLCVDVIMNPEAIGQDLGRRCVSLDRQKSRLGFISPLYAGRPWDFDQGTKERN